MSIIINLTVVNADWKEVWYNAVKRNWTITYFTSVLGATFFTMSCSKKLLRLQTHFSNLIQGLQQLIN
jgi:hypothetical protein